VSRIILFDLADWITGAACRGADIDLFFPERGRPATEAKAICSQCPVASECLAYAVTHRIKEGIWGGTTEIDRRRLYRRAPYRAGRPPSPHGTTTRYQRGCRCDPCREANRVYAADYKQRREATQ
jgi:hypothetical protein